MGCRFALLNGGICGRVGGLAGEPHVWGLGGVPWELALLVVGLDLLGLSERGKTIVSLVPEGGIVVRAKFFVEVNVA